MKDRQGDVAYQCLCQSQNTSCPLGVRSIAGEVLSAAMMPEIPFVPTTCGRILDVLTTETFTRVTEKTFSNTILRYSSRKDNVSLRTKSTTPPFEHFDSKNTGITQCNQSDCRNRNRSDQAFYHDQMLE